MCSFCFLMLRSLRGFPCCVICLIRRSSRRRSSRSWARSIGRRGEFLVRYSSGYCTIVCVCVTTLGDRTVSSWDWFFVLLVSHIPVFVSRKLVSSCSAIWPPPRCFRLLGCLLLRRIYHRVGAVVEELSFRWVLICSWKLLRLPRHVVACWWAVRRVFRTGFDTGDRIIDSSIPVRVVRRWLQHQGLSCPLTSYSDGKYFNTIEKVTIAYEVSIGNTTALWFVLLTCIKILWLHTIAIVCDVHLCV